jgi:hypothetical protein
MHGGALRNRRVDVPRQAEVLAAVPALLAPAHVLRGYVLKDMIGRGVRRYDFLAGDDPSKARWGTQVGNYVDLHFARPLTKGSLYLRYAQSAAQGKAWLRRRLPKEVWMLLHMLNLRLQSVRKPLVS